VAPHVLDGTHGLRSLDRASSLWATAIVTPAARPAERGRRRLSSARVPVALRGAEETLLSPLYARALDAGRTMPLLDDPWARPLVERLDYDFARLRGATPLRPVVRTALLDVRVRRFLREHPAGTVVEVGAGLNTRFERLDNGRVRWFDVDLPTVTALRRALLPPCDRRRHLAASAIAPAWLDDVARAPGPYCFVFEAVLGYLPDAALPPMLVRLARRFPGALLGLDLPRRWLTEGVGPLAGLASRPVSPCASALVGPPLGLELIEAEIFLAASTRPRGPSPASRPCRLAWFRSVA
jgi:Leucine carboxyl methyltransferase